MLAPSITSGDHDMLGLNRIRPTLVLLTCLFFTPLQSAQAQGTYPQKPIKIIVPVAAGGGTDFVARVVGQKLGEALSTPVIIENRPGGAGNVGVDAAAKADPDGYTLVMPITSFSVNPAYMPSCPLIHRKTSPQLLWLRQPHYCWSSTLNSLSKHWGI